MFMIHSFGNIVAVNVNESDLFMDDLDKDPTVQKMLDLNGQCGIVDINRVGYLSIGDCGQSLPFVCSSAPLYAEPDFGCPKGFVPYRDKCLYSDPRQLNYVQAQVRYSDV